MAENKKISNAQKAVAFLKAFRDQGNISVVAIHPQSGEVNGVTREIGDNYIEKFIAANEGTCNLYFMVNEAKSGAPTGKLKKHHVDKIHGLYIDADPKKDNSFDAERIRLKEFAEDLKKEEHPPTYIIDSGGGIQAFWLFDQPIPATEANIKHCEGLSRALAVKYDTDKVQNIDRIMRLPFTTNIPTEKKRKLGRKASLASVLHATSPRGDRYKQFSHIEPVHAEEKDNEVEGYDMSKLEDNMPRELLDKLDGHCMAYERLQNLWNGTFMNNDDRSDWDFALTDELKSLGYSLDEVAQILWCYPHGKGKEQNAREIARTYARAANDFMDFSSEIKDEDNPILQEKEKKRLKQSRRKGFITAGEATHKTSGKPLIKGLFDEMTTVLLYGPSNSGKSFLTLDMGMALASGQDYWDTFKIKRQCGVMVVAGEAQAAFGKRVEAARMKYGYEQHAPLEELPFAYLGEYLNFFNEKDDLEYLKEQIIEFNERSPFKCEVVIVDTLSSTFGNGNENEAKDARTYINNLKDLADELGFTIFIVHHTGKDASSGARGSYVFVGDVDTQLSVEAVKRGAKWDRKLTQPKQREHNKDGETTFVLPVKFLAKDEDGDDIDTCTVSFAGDPDYQDLSVSPFEALKKSHITAIKGLDLYENCNVPETEFIAPDGTEFSDKDVKSYIVNDLRLPVSKRNLTDADGNLKENWQCSLKEYAKPVDRKITLFLERQRTKIKEAGYEYIDEDFQLVNITEEQLKQLRNI